MCLRAARLLLHNVMSSSFRSSKQKEPNRTLLDTLHYRTTYTILVLYHTVWKHKQTEHIRKDKGGEDKSHSFYPTTYFPLNSYEFVKILCSLSSLPLLSLLPHQNL